MVENAQQLKHAYIPRDKKCFPRVNDNWMLYVALTRLDIMKHHRKLYYEKKKKKKRDRLQGRNLKRKMYHSSLAKRSWAGMRHTLTNTNTYMSIYI